MSPPSSSSSSSSSYSSSTSSRNNNDTTSIEKDNNDQSSTCWTNQNLDDMKDKHTTKEYEKIAMALLVDQIQPLVITLLPLR